MRWNLIIGIFLFLLITGNAYSQDKGKVTVIMDPQIENLISKRLALSRSGNSNSVTSSGFRVQIFSGLNREEAYAEQTRFKSLFPNVTSYISYTQPNYKLRVGDFRTKLEAQKFMNELKGEFSSIFIFEEKINPR